VLTDGVVLLRVPGTADVDRIAALCVDPDVRDWTTVPSPYTAEDAARFVDLTASAWSSGRACTWSVRDAGTDVLLGMIGLEMHEVRSAEIGYWLDPLVRGRGVMSRAVALVVAHAFDPDGLGLDRLLWTAFVGNAPSRAVAERAGFRVEGTVRGHGVQRGVRRDSWVGTLLATDPRPPSANAAAASAARP